ncbi:MAG: hypothetical protein J3R72DRAFT_520104 [Linnemannia gamsii]|nr:MAG: hypothetical protein J3R72DRAFT_520104 [Linnemannia gamsii]
MSGAEVPEILRMSSFRPANIVEPSYSTNISAIQEPSQGLDDQQLTHQDISRLFVHTEPTQETNPSMSPILTSSQEEALLLQCRLQMEQEDRETTSKEIQRQQKSEQETALQAVKEKESQTELHCAQEIPIFEIPTLSPQVSHRLPSSPSMRSSAIAASSAKTQSSVPFVALKPHFLQWPHTLRPDPVPVAPAPLAPAAAPIVVLVLVACLFAPVIHGQSDPDSESDSDPEQGEQPELPEQPKLPEQAPSSPLPPPPLSSPVVQPPAPVSPPAIPVVPATGPGTTPIPPPSTTSPGTPITPGTVTPPPNPIFSTSDACIACQKEFPTIRKCTALIPPAAVNLTTIVQILPFYNCLCQKDNMVEIDSLQQCSNCFRSTGQQAFLNAQFYNVTNQQVKAMKQVCEQTVDGTRVPTSGATAGGIGLVVQSTVGWGFVTALVSALLFLAPGGL